LTLKYNLYLNGCPCSIVYQTGREQLSYPMVDREGGGR